MKQKFEFNGVKNDIIQEYDYNYVISNPGVYKQTPTSCPNEDRLVLTLFIDNRLESFLLLTSDKIMRLPPSWSSCKFHKYPQEIALKFNN